MHYREIYFNLKMWPKINTAVESKGLLFDFQFNSTSDSIIALNSSTGFFILSLYFYKMLPFLKIPIYISDGKLYIITTLNQPIILDTETRQKVNTSVNLSEYPGRCKFKIVF